MSLEILNLPSPNGPTALRLNSNDPTLMIEYKVETSAPGETGAAGNVSIIGVGGAGANVIDHIALEGMEGVIEKYTGVPTLKPANPFLVTPLGIALNCRD